MKKGIFNWKKGAGSEIITVAITLITLAFLGYIVILYGGIYAEVQSQIMADIIADGSVAYAKTTMNIAEVPLRSMAKKIYNANVGLNSGVTLEAFDPNKDIVITPVSELPADAEFMSRAENQYLKPRAQVMSGVLKTYLFRQSDLTCFQNLAKSNNPSPQYEGISDLASDSYSTYDVSYYGPKYLDEIVTVTVSSSYDLPLVKNLTKKTKDAVELHTALVPYNSRTSNETSSRRHSIMSTIEEKAFEASLLTGDSADFSQAPRYGSIQQKVLLEGRRYIGDGYERNTSQGLNTTEYWPAIKSKIMFGSVRTTPADEALETNAGTSYSGFNAENRYKDCENFVNVCFNFDNTGGLSAALSKYPHKVVYRSVEYHRTVKSEEIWEEMHPDRIEYNIANLYMVNTSDFAEGKDYMVGPYGYWWHKYEYVKETDTQIVILDRTSSGDPIERIYKKSDGYNLITTSTSLIVQTAPPVTLYEEIIKYANPGVSPSIGGGTSHIWELTKADTWTDDMLQVGDVLVFYNPNRCDFVLPELIELANAETKDDVDFDKFNDPYRYVCHYAIYFGEYGGEKCVLDCSEGSAGREAVGVNPFRGTSAEPNTSGAILAEVIRFTNSPDATGFNYDEVELTHMD